MVPQVVELIGRLIIAADMERAAPVVPRSGRGPTSLTMQEDT